MTEPTFTVEQASAHAKEWCADHPGWQRICDVPNSDALYKTFAELPKRVQRAWEGRGGEAAWKEFGNRPCKVPRGFISGAGEFYRNVLDVPRFHNLMTVYKTGAREGQQP
ncbi:MAG: hypothetical protein ACN6O3_12495 [Comamonas sp.]